MAKRFRRNHNDGGSMLATMIVIILGAIMCSWVVLMAGSVVQDWMIAAIAVGAVALIAIILRYRYGQAQDSRLGFWASVFSNHNDDGLAANYRPRKIKDNQTGTPARQQPISPEELRDIRESSANTWVPAGPARRD